MTEPRRYNIIEIFGPTIQGEGPHAGRPVGFVRFGGCDFRCSWCDSMYAVEPAEVRANSEKLTADEIVDRLPACDVVVLSGGNPALVQGEQLAEALALAGKAADPAAWHQNGWLIREYGFDPAEFAGRSRKDLIVPLLRLAGATWAAADRAVPDTNIYLVDSVVGQQQEGKPRIHHYQRGVEQLVAQPTAR